MVPIRFTILTALLVIAVCAIGIGIGVLWYGRSLADDDEPREVRIATLQSTHPESQEVSLVQLIGSPTAYHAKAISAFGRFQLRNDTARLFLTSDDAKHFITRNGLWLDIDEMKKGGHASELRKFDGLYVRVEGVFEAGSTEFYDLYPGGIKKVWRIVEKRQVD